MATHSHRFYSRHLQDLLDARQRMEEDEHFRETIQESDQNWTQFGPILFSHESDPIQLVIIRDYAVCQQLMMPAWSPFAQLPVAELAHGLRLDRFLVMGFQWLHRDDLTDFGDIRTLVNGL